MQQASNAPCRRQRERRVTGSRVPPLEPELFDMWSDVISGTTYCNEGRGLVHSVYEKLQNDSSMRDDIHLLEMSEYRKVKIILYVKMAYAHIIC